MDGFLCEFYNKCWDYTRSNLWNINKKVIYIVSLGSIINKGNVKFIPEEGDMKLITN